jgi:hypothetical protein
MAKSGSRTYDPEYHCADLIARRALGELDCQIFAAWDISRNCFYKWLRDHPELKEAQEMSKEKWEANWVRRGIDFMEAGDDKKYRYWNKVMSVLKL